MGKTNKVMNIMNTLRYGRPSEKIQVIVVAGKAGKTTTCHLIEKLLREAGEDPLLLSHHMKEGSAWTDYRTNIGVLQKALSHAVQQKRRYAIVEADKDLATVIVGTTFSINTLVALSDEPYIQDLLAMTQFAVVPHNMNVETFDTHRVMTFGEDQAADMYIEDIRQYKKGTELTLRVDHHYALEIATYLIGLMNARNVAAALATMYVLSMDTKYFPDGVAELESIPGNYTYIDTAAPYTVVADRAYTAPAIHDVVATTKALAKRRLIVVIDDIMNDEVLKMYLDTADRIIMVGQTEHVRITPATSLDEAVALALRAARQGDTVLFLGESFLQKGATNQNIIEDMVERP